jgi:Mlc titration factor MtfA (ptsG expression regulator)
MIGLVCIAIIIIFVIATYADKKQRIRNFLLPPATRRLLEEHVDFYKKLDKNNKQLFEARIKDFLATTTIRGIDTNVEDLDRILVASGAIIPIFSFPDWKYNNISEVLLYKDAFTHGFKTEGGKRNILGMVGDGPLHREMILSKPSLRLSFSNAADGQNTAIHEFIHLLDKADGEADGIPEYLLSQPGILPWVNKIHETIKEMKTKKHSDINLYGATNDTEFFAVVSEYFFERPDKLKANHPELYEMLDRMFHPQVVAAKTT